MSLEPRSDDGVPGLTARVVRAAFPRGTLAVRLREALGPLFEDEDFAEAFPVSGCPAASPGALALVSVLQHAEKLSGRQAADQVRARMDWEFLLGLELDDPGFGHAVLGGFRERLIRHGMEEKVLDAVLARLSGAGLLRAGGRQRTGSTHVLASVRALNRMEFAGETLRAALEALAAADPAWLSGLIGPERIERYGSRTGSYRFPGGEDSRDRWLRQAGRDGLALLDAAGPASAPEWLAQVPAAAALRRARDQQYRRSGEGVRWREGKDLPPGSQRLASPYDPGARYGVKRGAGWTGCKVHLTEACEPDLPHLITDAGTTGATVDDAGMTPVVRQHLADRRLTPDEHAAGAGYVSAGRILAARDDHGITLTGPVGAGTTQGGGEPLLPRCAFHVDRDARTVTCPHGAASISWSGQRKPGGIPAARVHFALAGCNACPLRPRCTKASHGRRGRSLTLLSREQHEEPARQRAGQQTPEWKARCNVRAGAEGTISQAVRATRLRRTPCRGRGKTHLANVLNAAALNLIRADARLNGTPPGTARVSHPARPNLAA